MTQIDRPVKGHHEFMSFTGCETINVPSGFHEISNSFTYELWIRPEGNIQIQTESNSGWSGIEGQKFVIAPEHGRNIDEAGSGISIGKNGIAIYEHSAGYLPAVLVCPLSISGWTHLAIVYQNGRPRLYVNGVYTRQGVPSSKSTVYPSGIFGGLNPYGFFVGQLEEIRLWNDARSEAQIQWDMNQELTGHEPGLCGLWKFSKNRLARDITANANDGEFRWGNYLLAVLSGAHKIPVHSAHPHVVDLIIPVESHLEQIQKCIKSVFMNSDVPYHLYLINNAPPHRDVLSYLELLQSIQPPNLQSLHVIDHTPDEEVVRSVNKVMQLSKHDVILLNDNTEVPSKWMSRLLSPLLLDEKIASVTPFSNCVSVLPDMSSENSYAAAMNVEEMDELFQTYGTDIPIKIPTTNGFCVAIRRDAMDAIEYFKPNEFVIAEDGDVADWCRRANRAGFSNVLLPNLCVCCEEAPCFPAAVQEDIESPPAKGIREVIDSFKAVHKLQNRKGVLFVLHNTGGGTEHFQNQFIDKVKQQSRVYRLQYGLSRFVFSDLNHDTSISYSFDSITKDLFHKLLEYFEIELIHVDHLRNFPIPFIMDLIQGSGVHYTFQIHDYFSVCPQIYLLNHLHTYCHDETDMQKCQHCLDHSVQIDIQFWRKRFSSFLGGAMEVTAPSVSTSETVRKYYPHLDIQVQEHSLPNYIRPTFHPEFVNIPDLNVAVVGDIYYHKGSQVLYELREHIHEEGLPINIKVIGMTELHPGYFLSADGKFMVTGAFQNQEISKLLAENQVSIVIVPSICPETYSYTTSEAMMSGYPVIAFNLGAPPARIRKYDGGWVVDEFSSLGVLNLLKRLLQNKNEILDKANHLRMAFER